MPPGDRKGPILVVDDDPDVRDALVDTLQDEGYEVVQMPGGREALDYLRANPKPALIFLDWNMTPMNAPKFMEEFSNDGSNQGVPVILITADVHASDKVLTNRYSAFITKPVNLDTLFALVEQFLRR
jgi:DNA-binding response OmpR family regulator